jgi:hypothetical protein
MVIMSLPACAASLSSQWFIRQWRYYVHSEQHNLYLNHIGGYVTPWVGNLTEAILVSLLRSPVWLFRSHPVLEIESGNFLKMTSDPNDDVMSNMFQTQFRSHLHYSGIPSGYMQTVAKQQVRINQIKQVRKREIWVATVVDMKIIAFWNITQCSLVKRCQSFG